MNEYHFDPQKGKHHDSEEENEDDAEGKGESSRVDVAEANSGRWLLAGVRVREEDEEYNDGDERRERILRARRAIDGRAEVEVLNDETEATGAQQHISQRKRRKANGGKEDSEDVSDSVEEDGSTLQAPPATATTTAAARRTSSSPHTATSPSRRVTTNTTATTTSRRSVPSPTATEDAPQTGQAEQERAVQELMKIFKSEDHFKRAIEKSRRSPRVQASLSTSSSTTTSLDPNGTSPTRHVEGNLSWESSCRHYFKEDDEARLALRAGFLVLLPFFCERYEKGMRGDKNKGTCIHGEQLVVEVEKHVRGAAQGTETPESVWVSFLEYTSWLTSWTSA